METKKYLAIVIFGDYVCYDVYTKFFNESHTSAEWVDIYKKETEVEDEYDECCVEIHKFQTKEELKAFAKGIRIADNYYCSDVYTIFCQTDRITDSSL